MSPPPPFDITMMTQILSQVIGGILALSQAVDSKNYLRCTFTTREHVMRVYLSVVGTEIAFAQKKRKERHAELAKDARKSGTPAPKPLDPKFLQKWDPTKLPAADIPEQLRTEGLQYYAWAFAPAHAIEMVMRGLLHPVCAVDGTHSVRIHEVQFEVLLLAPCPKALSCLVIISTILNFGTSINMRSKIVNMHSYSLNNTVRRYLNTLRARADTCSQAWKRGVLTLLCARRGQEPSTVACCACPWERVHCNLGVLLHALAQGVHKRSRFVQDCTIHHYWRRNEGHPR